MEDKNKNSKLSRRKIREELFKIIFGLEFNENLKLKDNLNNLELDEFEKEKAREQLNNYIQLSESITHEDDIMYIEKVIGIYLDNRKDILENIAKYLKDTWTLDRLTKTSIALIQLAIIEMEYLDLDYKIAINEALEISKKYQDKKEVKFINGILSNFVSENEKNIKNTKNTKNSKQVTESNNKEEKETKEIIENNIDDLMND